MDQTTADSEKKVLTYAIGAETTDLSTLYMNNSLCCTSKLVYENLVDFDNGEIVPGLAESWEYKDDQTELTFHLRQGVTFHNGEPVLTPRRSRLTWNISSPIRLSTR